MSTSHFSDGSGSQYNVLMPAPPPPIRDWLPQQAMATASRAIVPYCTPVLARKPAAILTKGGTAHISDIVGPTTYAWGDASRELNVPTSGGAHADCGGDHPAMGHPHELQ